jgi:hypothetical protein
MLQTQKHQQPSEKEQMEGSIMSQFETDTKKYGTTK